MWRERPRPHVLRPGRNLAGNVGVSNTMVRSLALALLFAFPCALAQNPNQTELFVWRYNGSILGFLDVPRGFTSDTDNYREGIVTTLHYPDGSSIILQRGFMYRIPLFQDEKDVLDSSAVKSGTTVRRGHYKGKRECWGEIDYKPPVKTVEKAFLGIIGPNLGYAHVPRKRADEFFRALESFRLPE